MNQGSYIFSQLLGYVPKDVFDRIVRKYDGNKYVKSFTCWNQFCVMVYAHLAERESLRDMESVLMHHQSQIYTAISAYCIVAIAEHRLNLDREMYEVLRVLQGSLYEKIPLRDFFEAGRKCNLLMTTPLLKGFSKC